MPLVLIFFGIVLIITAVRGKTKDFYLLLADDSKGFLVYVLVFGAVYLLGKIKPMQDISTGFMVLFVIALILASGRQFFNQITVALQGASK